MRRAAREKAEWLGIRYPPGWRHDISHVARPELDGETPVHVTMHANIRGLRRLDVYKAFHRILRTYLGDRYFRITHISIQTNHLHMLVEAADKLSLSRGMQGFTIRAARAINKIAGRTGKVFEHRYFAKPIRDARHARNAIKYVLTNFRRHNADREGAARFDFFSSAASFAYWLDGMPPLPADYDPLPVTQPRTALLARDWLAEGGLIDPRRGPMRQPLHRG